MFRWKRLLAVVCFLLVVIIIQSRNEEVSGRFKGVLGNILNPLVYLSDRIFGGIGGLWHSYVALVGVQAQNDEYKRLIGSLSLENTLLKEKVSQSKRLQDLMRFSEAYDFTTVACNVIGASDGYLKHIIIDRGSLDGVAKDDPVIGFNGLVGRVTRAFATTAEVGVILDISSNVSVLNSRTRAVGILRGDGKGRLFVDYYDRLDDATPGDGIITSGLGRLFPKGIPVGRVSEVVKAKSGLFQNVYVEQDEDLYKLENVFVVKNFKK